jgi:hypothetical protein
MSVPEPDGAVQAAEAASGADMSGGVQVAGELAKSIIGIGPSGLAIVVLLIMLAGAGFLILRMTGTILSIREMTTDTDRDVARSLSDIGTKLETIRWILTHGAGGGSPSPAHIGGPGNPSNPAGGVTP